MADKKLKTQNELCSRLEKAEKNFQKSPKIRITKSYLETRIQSLQELWEMFKANHIRLIEDLTDEQIKSVSYFTEDKYDWFEESYTSYMTDLKDALIKFTEKPQTEEIIHASSSSTEIQLPRIHLPTFNGKYEEWQTYYDMFVSLIHQNEKLSKVQKLHYLKSSVSGEPEQLLRNFSTTEQNYDEAWKQLTRRYANKRYNSNAVFKILFSQKPISHESAPALKQLLDTTTSCLKALNNMGFNTETWDPIVIYLVITKLDVESHKQWENQMSMMADEIPTWDQLVDFLEARFRSLEMVDSGKNLQKTTVQSKKAVLKPKTLHAAVKDDKQKAEVVCIMCNGHHYLNLCNQFNEMTVQDRRTYVQANGLCFNCLKSSHVVGKCRQSVCCKRCNRRHHTMLHFEREGFADNARPKVECTNESSTGTPDVNIVANFSKKEHHSYNVLLATAVLKARSVNGNKCVIRALLDQGSQASFVTEATAQLLSLKRTSVNGLVSGLGDGHTRIKHAVSFFVESRHNPEISIEVTAYVLRSLTSLLPSDQLNDTEWLELKGLELADPGYALPGKIDVLLGADVHSEILLNGLIKHPKENFMAQNTVFGWVLSGKLSSNTSTTKNNFTSLHLKIKDEEDWLKQFWELEAEPDRIQKKLSKEEETCEDFYEKTTFRNEDGRFVVRLPFRNEDPECQYNQSLAIATKSLASLERRLAKNPKLYEEYRKVLEEYVSLNHMELVEENDLNNPKAVYLPHHAVVREDRETRKVRVVFNASSKGLNGVSLNDDLLVGPRLQQELRHLLMRWRTHRICLIADLVKMYRQVRVNEKDTNFQRILWRPFPNMPVQHYKLLTLTFGTACAPYLAVKTLQKLAEEEKAKFPMAAEITKKDFYVDDLMTGCNTEAEAKKIYEEMNAIMSSGGFQLQKWSTNNKEVLRHIDKGNQRNNEMTIKKDDTLKVLGIRWNKQTDEFEYTVNLPELRDPITKRQVLSDIARLYDWAGFLQ